MARLEYIDLSLERCSISDEAVLFEPELVRDAKTGLRMPMRAQRTPQLLWASGEPWSEANIWLLTRARLLFSGMLKDETVAAGGKDLASYAEWLEAEGRKWWECPPKDSLRPLNLYRGHLVGLAEAGRLSRTLASRRIATLKSFYRWLLSEQILSPGFPLWSEKNVRVSYDDAFGFRRHVGIVRTSLDISAAKRPDGVRLEDGLQPVSAEVRDALLSLAHRQFSREIYLMLSLGFWSGLRLGTITDLKVKTIESSVPIDTCPDLRHLSVGPQANPPVRMKLGQRSDGIVIPTPLLDELLEYSVSLQRGKRVKLAAPANRNILFLTKHGNPYGSRGPDRSPSVNAEISRLKRAARGEGLAIDGFTFHWSRATFATMWARAARASGNLHEFMPTLKRMLAHKHDHTTERYVAWVEEEDVRTAVMDEFTREMFGRFYSSEAKRVA